MDVVTFSAARANLRSVMDRVADDHAPVVVTRQRGEAVVMVSLADWSAIEETLYLQSSPTNARLLREAIEELERGEGQERALVEA